MNQIQMRNLLLAGIAGMAMMGAPPALAQKVIDLPQPALPLADPSEVIDNKNIEKRLQREEKALRDLRQIVLKAQAQGNPVTVKLDGPDPQITELQNRISDLEETLRKQTGQMEVMAHDAQMAAKSAADANDAAKSLALRLDAVEKQLSNVQAGAVPPGAPPGPGAGAGAAVNMGSGVLGTLRLSPGAPPPGAALGSDEGAPPAVDEAAAYRSARQVLDSGDYVGGAAALQAFLQQYPNSPRAPEANYWLGRTLALRSMHAEAAAAYARSLKGWPQTAWAGDAVVRLSTSLIELKRNPDACKALEEFSMRYSAKALPAVKARAKDSRAAAACG
jgi:tol-pal system protein YbgF